MSWRSFARDLDRAHRRSVRYQQASQRAHVRQERDAARRQRELDKLMKERQKAEAAETAKLEVAEFENYLELLVSVHKQAGLAWDWQSSATALPPTAPTRSDEAERTARAARAAFVPGFFDRLFRQVDAKVAKLEGAIAAAQALDESVFVDATNKWRESHGAWEHERKVGQRVLARDGRTYAAALTYAGAFDEVSAYGASVTVTASTADAVVVHVEITDDEIVPTEVVKLTASGKLSSKAMPKGQYWDLYQDHVCSCAIRVASEVFAALPVDRVIVNTGSRQVSSATGHPELVTHLAVHFTRAELEKLNLDRIDPSDSMRNFSHHMQFAKTSGFKPVDPITLDDQFVTT